MADRQNPETKKHFHLYVLKLEHGKYYVGLTTQSNPRRRIAKHKSGFAGAAWTRLHEPIKTLELRDLGSLTQEEADKIEEQTTLRYMKKHGYNNVRGAYLSYTGKYVRRFGLFFQHTEYQAAMTIILLMLIMGILYFT